MSDKIYDTELTDLLRQIEDTSYSDVALRIFREQYQGNKLYKMYVDSLNIDVSAINSVEEIPFLPVEFFKTHTVKNGSWEPVAEFSSSGTTGSNTSKHLVKNLDDYLFSCLTSFKTSYGDPSDYVFLALLPSYLDRKGSSLIAMMEHFIALSNSKLSGFFLHDHNKLFERYKMAEATGEKIMIWGVSFALLDFIDNHDFETESAIIIETGGMKGRRKEMIREELHENISRKLKSGPINSEYGMTELFSQAYSKGEGIFKCSPFMKVFTREISDPLSVTMAGEAGCINIIDLANYHSCSFIATQDVGKWHDNGTFEITGRLDNSDIRGCNLMIV